MAMFVKKPQVFECYTFEDLIALGRHSANAVITNKLLERFIFKGFPVTREDVGYKINAYGKKVCFGPGQVVVYNDSNSCIDIYDKEVFDRKFQITFA